MLQQKLWDCKHICVPSTKPALEAVKTGAGKEKYYHSDTIFMWNLIMSEIIFRKQEEKQMPHQIELDDKHDATINRKKNS